MRPPIAAPIAVLVLALAMALSACGSSSEETTRDEGGATTSALPGAPAGATAKNCPLPAASGKDLRVTGVPCTLARLLVSGWYRNAECSAGASRTACSLSGFKCLGAVTDRGIAVSCARPGQSVSFLARRPG